MLDKEDLQAIQAMLEAMEQRTDAKLEAMGQHTDTKLEAMEQCIDKKLEAMEQRVSKNTITLMDAEFGPRFNLLAEGQQDILEKVVPRSRVDELEDEVKFLKSIVRQINEDVQGLKKAN